MSAPNPEREADAWLDDAAARERGAAEARRLLEKAARLLEGAGISPSEPCARAASGQKPAYDPERIKAEFERAGRHAIRMIYERKSPKKPMLEIARLLQHPLCQGVNFASLAQLWFIECAEVLNRDDARKRAEHRRSKVLKKLAHAEEIAIEKERTGSTKTAIENVKLLRSQRTGERRLTEAKRLKANQRRYQEEIEEYTRQLAELYKKAGLVFDEDES